MDDLSSRLRSIVSRHGGNAIGWFEGTGTPADFLGREGLTKLLASLGSTRHYSAATIDVAPLLRMSELVTGYFRARPLWIPEDPQSRLALLLGINPAVSHGYQTVLSDPFRRIKEFRRRGGKLWVVDPRRTKTSRLADHYLSIRPGTDYILLAFLLRELLGRRRPDLDFIESTTPGERDRLVESLQAYTVEEAERRTDIPASRLEELASAVVETERLAILPGTGLSFQRDAIVTDWLRWVILCVTGSLDRPGGMWFNPGWFEQLDLPGSPFAGPAVDLPLSESRPELERLGGQLHVASIPPDIERGHLRAFFVNGGNPARSFPEPARTAAALRSLDLLIVLDVVDTATARLASHVAPVTGQLERTDLVFEVTRAMMARPVLSPPPSSERKPVWWVAAQIGKRLGIDLLDGRCPDVVSETDLMRQLLRSGRSDLGDLMEAGPHGVPLQASGFMRRRFLRDGRWNILPAEVVERWKSMTPSTHVGGRFLFLTGRQLTRNGSIDYVPPERKADAPTIVMNPSDASELGARADSTIKVSSRSGSVTGRVKTDERMRAGTLSFAQGWPETHSAELCSLDADVDLLSGQPIMSGIPVEIELV
jgi:anaerobic selenocysteine-containing dehydrogenase